jgi:hypothetical protein
MYSNDSGLHWYGEVDDGALIDPRAKNAVSSWTSVRGTQGLVHVGSADPLWRDNTTALFSFDGGRQWTDPVLVYRFILLFAFFLGDAVGENGNKPVQLPS